MLHNVRHQPLPRKPHPKFTRLEKRRRVTLIAAFRCRDGVVLCADEQETVGDIRVAVNKLKPEDAGANYQLAIAGSGNSDLIDGFAYKLKLDVAGWDVDADERLVYGYLQSAVQDYHENEVKYYPADSADDKLNHFLVCIRPNNRSDIFLWELRGTAIVPVADYTLMGVTASIYQHELKRLYPDKEKIDRAQAMTLAVHLFSLAKATSNYIGGQTRIVFVGPDGMDLRPSEDVAKIEQRIDEINRSLGSIMLEMANLEGSEVRVEKAFKLFREEILGLRREVREHTLQIHDSLHRHWGDHVSLSVGSVEPVFVPESPRQNPQPKKVKKTSKRKKP